ncbi:hypothetical protein DFQ28_001798 [Apophysomyces sp. BC1034]|nr:hypothetical protein DFQ29_010187 [Apophysomyces sp. BC1021]KAG0190591.1 hypothetical protein DFQ28_001798 [Apophysomyces sp. BC1034]
MSYLRNQSNPLKLLPHASQALEGYNAYGQRWSDYGSEAEPGMIPRAIGSLFNFIKQTGGKEFVIRVSYCEIDNDIVRDLLAPENEDLKIYEDKRRGIWTTSLTEQVIVVPEDIMNVIKTGEANSCYLSSHCHRNHTILQLTIESYERSSHSTPLSSQRRSRTPGTKNTRQQAKLKVSQLNFVDFGCAKLNCCGGNKRREDFTSTSPQVLETTITDLIKESGSSRPYPNDTTLKRYLQPLLADHAKVAAICTLSPDASNIEASLETLRFASRMKKLEVSPRINEILDERVSLILKYRKEIVTIKNKIQQLSKSSKPHLPSNPSKEVWEEVLELRRELQETAKKKNMAEQQLMRHQKLVKELETRLEENKDLVDEVARYEAELSITRAMFFFKDVDMKSDKYQEEPPTIITWD